MKVQFLADVKKNRHGKVARLKQFEQPAIKLNDNNVEVIPYSKQTTSYFICLEICGGG
jgi:hypothetical protein